MTFHSIMAYLQSAWQELAVGGLLGYLVAALKPISTLVKAFQIIGKVRVESGLRERSSLGWKIGRNDRDTTTATVSTLANS